LVFLYLFVRLPLPVIARFVVSGITVGLFCSTLAVALARNLGRRFIAGGDWGGSGLLRSQ